MDQDKTVNDSLCKDALDTCSAIHTNLLVLQTRLILGLPVEETAECIDRDMQALDDQIDAIGDAIMGDDDVC